MNDYSSYQKKQIEVINKIEKQIVNNSLSFSTVAPVEDFEKGKKEIANIVESLEPAKQAEIANNLLDYEPISQAWRWG